MNWIHDMPWQNEANLSPYRRDGGTEWDGAGGTWGVDNRAKRTQFPPGSPGTDGGRIPFALGGPGRHNFIGPQVKWSLAGYHHEPT